MNACAEISLKQFPKMLLFELRPVIFGWRILALAAVTVLMLAGAAVAPPLYTEFADSLWDRKMKTFLFMVPALVFIISAILLSDSISSQFESGTGTVILSKPVSRYTVFASKYTAAFIVGTVFALIYIACAATVVRIEYGKIPDLSVTVGLTISCLFFSCGLAVFISSVSPKTSISVIIMLALAVLVIFLMPAPEVFPSEPWYLPSYLIDAISSDIGKGFYFVTYDTHGIRPHYVPDSAVSAAVMLIYGSILTIAASAVYRLRNF